MEISPETVRSRWDKIRSKPECDLALTPASVRKYLDKSEADLVAERIQESLVQLATYRVQKGGFRSRIPPGPGDLAICEGLEAFLVPAVEGALEFSSVIHAITGEKLRQDFITAIVNDIGEIAAKWEKDQFSGRPYAEEDDIVEALDEKRQAKLEVLNITEAAAMACRVLIHLLTLKNLPQSKEKLFRKEIGERLNDKIMLKGLQKAIEFLVRSFQMNLNGNDVNDKIAKAEYGGDPGSGWSWTEWQGLPPMLFFTASAVDAFAELDLYLIRPSEASTQDAEPSVLKEFYYDNQTAILSFQLCVDMARRWIQNTVLPKLSLGDGQYAEPEIKYLNEDEDRFKLYKVELERSDIKYPPILYNSLYGLQILLWSWADWDEYGVETDAQTKRWINQALAQLVYSYDSVPAVKEILRKVDHKFVLPGEGFYKPGTGDKCQYLDAGFLPSLTRLLVLFLVYGVGDRNLLEPVIRDLYVELLQNRNRTSKEFGMLWSGDGVEIFSTQRATQALTFYWAYASGKEATTKTEKRESLEDLLVLRNKTKYKLALELSDVEARAAEAAPKPDIPPVEPKATRPDWADAPNFAKFLNDYHKKLFDEKEALVEPEEKMFRGEVSDLGSNILQVVKSDGFKDFHSARMILNALARVFAKPALGKSLRNLEYEMLREQYEELKRNHNAVDVE